MIKLEKVETLLHARHVRTLPVSGSIAVEAAQIRADYNLRTPDAIQLATALDARASAFLTNDAGLASVPGLRLIQLDSLLP
jgi:predicted nucleic acid-binding protein